MTERKRIGYVHEQHVNFEHKSWIAEQDLESTDPEVQNDVQEWLFGLSEPWSFQHYFVSCNHKNKLKNPEEMWKAEYISPFYDGMSSVAFGYGSTPQEAIANVDNLVKTWIGKYLKVDEQDLEPKPILTEEKLLDAKTRMDLL